MSERINAWTNAIRCPLCGAVDEEVSDYPWVEFNAGRSVAKTCGECDRDFDVSANVTWTFVSRATVAPPNETAGKEET